MAVDYKKRVVDQILLDKLNAKGGVVIEGTKWCGKTTTAMQAAGSVLRMDEPSRRKQNMDMAEINPSLLLQGTPPRLVDEWQIAPELWDAARYEIDQRNAEGQFIFTGSSVPVESEKIYHSGTGRFTWLTMRTMSLYESLESTGEVSLGELFDDPKSISGINPIDINQLAFLICRGGWPRSIDMMQKAALEQAKDYFDAVVKSDISRADGIVKDEARVVRLMRSFARHQGTQISMKMLKDDIVNNESFTISEDTIAAYISALKKIFVIEDMPAWNPNLRSKTAIRSSDTRYFVDPSIASAAQGIGPNDLLNDLHTMGLLFETLVVRDLRVYAQLLDGDVLHYRDKSGLECDTVIHLRNGSYGLAEVKLGGERLIEEGAKNLKTLSDKIDTQKMNAPSFLMIIIGVGDYAYKRKDGVFIVPIGCLKP